VLGVCRGAQLLNVAFGGTLHQHLPDVVGHDGHNPTLGEFNDIDVRLDPAGRSGPPSGRTCGCAATTTRRSTRSRRTWWRRAGPPTARSKRWRTRRAVRGRRPVAPEEDVADIRLFAALLAAAAHT
jgi:hypothetical protein